MFNRANIYKSMSDLFPVLNETLAILNTSANQLMFDDWEQRKTRSQCIRCAVVGNAGILNGSKKGLEIDQCDYVFRCDDIWSVLFREMQSPVDLKLDKPQTWPQHHRLYSE